MKKTVVVAIAFAVLVPVLAQAQGALQVVTVNTDDVPGYLSWVESSAPVMA